MSATPVAEDAPPAARVVGRRPGGRWAAGAALLYLAGSVAMTWPLAAHLSSSTPSTFPDSRHVVWLLSWGAHSFFHNPAGLFQAPYFWPQPDTLAYADHITGLTIFGAPIVWLTGNPYLAHNLLFIAALAFTGWSMFLLAYDLTGSRAASFVAGAAFAFSPYWFGPIIQTSHLQSIANGWMPLAFLGLRRWLRSAEVRPLALLTGAWVMSVLTSWYQGTFLTTGLLVAAPFFLAATRPRRWSRLIRQAVAAGLVAVLVVAPFALPYLRVGDTQSGYERTLHDTEFYGARTTSFVAAPETNVVWGDRTARWRERQSSLETHLFPGAIAVALSLVGLATLRRSGRDRHAVLAFVAILAVGVVLSFGGGAHGARRWLPWSFLFDHLIAFRSLRAVARVHVLTLLSLAVLVAVGTKTMLAHLPKKRAIHGGLTLVLTALIATEGAAVPLRLGAAIPPALPQLASRPGAVLELPTAFRSRDGTILLRTRDDDVDYMLAGTAYWRPLVNGYSSFDPSTYLRLVDALATFPDAASVALLRRWNVRTIVVHDDRLRGTPWEPIRSSLERTSHFRLISRAAAVSVYDLPP